MVSALQIFGRTVRDMRRQRSMSQEELADLCNLHRTYIGGVERGERNVGLLNILRIAQALGVPPSELFRDLVDSAVPEQTKTNS